MIITLEANIGAGKSTLLKYIADAPFKVPHIVICEKIEDWTRSITPDNASILELFYQDKKKYSYIFQSYVLMSRVGYLLETIKNNPDKIIICERSLMTDYKVFAKTLHEDGDMTDVEMFVYNEWHNLVRNTFNIPIIGQVYLQTPPEMCLDRIQKRARQGENSISLNYLSKIHQKHEEWLCNANNTLIVDGAHNLVDDMGARNAILQKINDFVYDIYKKSKV
jgi:deoxyadenosine/deoxycytidine kinase